MKRLAWLLALTLPVTTMAAGFIKTEQVDGRWWLVGPDGQRFISKGVCCVGPKGDNIYQTKRQPYGEATLAKYGTVEAWREATAQRLFGWGFNTLGAWSDVKVADVKLDGRQLFYTVNLNLGAAFVGEQYRGTNAWLAGIFPDVFDPRFAESASRIATQKCAALKDDPRLLGWFSDNELRWRADWRGSDELLTLFLNLPTNAPGRQTAVTFLRDRYGDVAKFNAVWQTTAASWDELGAVTQPFANRKPVQNQALPADGKEAPVARADCEAFLGVVADRYFTACRAAIKAADPNHLVMGCRFAYNPDDAVLKAAAKHLDVLSVNCYSVGPGKALQAYGRYGRPIVIGEFTFRGGDVGVPNKKGAGPKVATQQDRANGYETYVREAMAVPAVVGFHWFQHNDQPKEGRFDGENSNYGLVNIADDVYEVLTKRMTEVNAQTDAWHRGK